MGRETNERPGSERHACHYLASWSYFNKDARLDGRILNFNLTGSYLQVDRPIIQGATLMIWVLAAQDSSAEYPHGLPMHAVAEVKWCREVDTESQRGYVAGLRYCYPV